MILMLLWHASRIAPWITGTHIYDERPRSLRVAIRQRHRWMIGHMRVAGSGPDHQRGARQVG